MFEFIKKIFSRVPKKKEEGKVESKSTQRSQKTANSSLPIPYNSNLIKSFKSEHQRLLELHSNIINAAKIRDEQQIINNITQFSQEITKHLSEEFTDLYVFLEFFATEHLPVEKETISNFRKEMEEIATTVMSIIHKHQAATLESNESFDELISDFNTLGGALVDRISREEDVLYPMYDSFAHQFGVV